jgi:hypothetical protein
MIDEGGLIMFEGGDGIVDGDVEESAMYTAMAYFGPGRNRLKSTTVASSFLAGSTQTPQ